MPDITGYYRIHDRSTPKWLSGARHFKRTWPVEENFYSNLVVFRSLDSLDFACMFNKNL